MCIELITIITIIIAIVYITERKAQREHAMEMLDQEYRHDLRLQDEAHYDHLQREYINNSDDPGKVAIISRMMANSRVDDEEDPLGL